MRYVILHYHILKNAGATVEEILHNSFRGKFLRFDTPDRDASVPSSDLLPILEKNPHLRAVSSHQIRHPVPVVPGYVFLDLCFLRDPIDRVRSMYDYFRDKPVAGDPVSELANGLGLGEFVARVVDEIPWYVTDIQVNLLANGIANDPPEPQDLERALHRMLETSFLGVVDHFNESVAAGQYFLNPIFPELDCAHPPVNVSNRARSTLETRNQQLQDACDPSVYSRLLSLNVLDLELVARARAEVRRRFDLLPNQKTRLETVGQTGGISEWITPKPGTREPARLIPEPPVIKSRPGLVTKLRRTIQLRPYLQSRLFDAEFYRQTYPDVTGNPLVHFLTTGAAEGRNPHPLFDTNFYLRKYPDVAHANLNPLGHYLKHGAAEGRQPHPLFDPVYYLEHNPDVRAAGINPLLHYMEHGAQENRRPHRWFVPDYYLLRCPDARRPGINPLLHFLESDPRTSASPHPLFDCEAYAQEHPDIAVNPLVDWLSRPEHVETGAGLSFQWEIDDVTIRIRFFDAQPPESVPSGVIPIWRDRAGRTMFAAPVQQLPFFEGLNYDQLRAQFPCDA
jgi:hypothetical protein